VLKKIFGPKRQEITGEDCLMRSFVICAHRQNVIKVIKSWRMKWAVNVMQSFIWKTRNQLCDQSIERKDINRV
jgi:hypothetical protein